MQKPQQIHAIAASLLLLLSAKQAGAAQGPGEALSYAAGGSCYCTSATPQLISPGKVLPTPVGGQTISQICERVGTGPGLVLQDGLFNHPAYSDAQCGHGPFPVSVADHNCTGLSAPGQKDCSGTGPKWDLETAYAKQPITQPPTTSITIVEQPASFKSAQPLQVAEQQTTQIVTSVTPAQNTQPIQTSTTIVGGNTWVETEVDAPIANTVTATNIDSTPELGAAILVQQETGSLSTTAYAEDYYDPATEIASGPINSESIDYGNLSSRDIAMLPEANTIPAGTPREFLSNVEAEAYLHEPVVQVINVDGSITSYSQEQIDRLNIEKFYESPGANGTAGQPTPSLGAAKAADATTTGTVSEVETAAALAAPSLRAGSRMNYKYVDATPATYDYGGPGIQLEASVSTHNRIAYFARTAISDDYAEGAVGLGLFFSPFSHKKTDFVLNLGVEHGNFDLGITDFDSTGGYVAGYVRAKPLPRFEIQGGASYSSFFEGDAAAFASGIVQITKQLNAVSKVELGDNDHVSLGFRFYY